MKNERDIKRRLAGGAKIEPPAGLLEAIQDEIPEETFGPRVVALPESGTADWRWRVAAAAVAVVAAGLLAVGVQRNGRLSEAVPPISEMASESVAYEPVASEDQARQELATGEFAGQEFASGDASRLQPMSPGDLEEDGAALAEESEANGDGDAVGALARLQQVDRERASLGASSRDAADLEETALSKPLAEAKAREVAALPAERSLRRVSTPAAPAANAAVANAPVANARAASLPEPVADSDNAAKKAESNAKAGTVPSSTEDVVEAETLPDAQRAPAPRSDELPAPVSTRVEAPGAPAPSSVRSELRGARDKRRAETGVVSPSRRRAAQQEESERELAETPAGLARFELRVEGDELKVVGTLEPGFRLEIRDESGVWSEVPSEELLFDAVLSESRLGSLDAGQILKLRTVALDSGATLPFEVTVPFEATVPQPD